jgi:predicted ATP-dependent serine protease
MVIIMSVVYLDLISTSLQRRETNLFLIDSDMTMSMPMIMSMSMTVAVVMMAARRVHPKQVDC